MQAVKIVKSSQIQKEPIREEDENEISNGAEEAVSTNKKSKSKSKKSKKVPQTLEAPPSESTKSPDVSESPKTPKSAKLISLFRKRSSSDSKALKPKSTSTIT